MKTNISKAFRTFLLSVAAATGLLLSAAAPAWAAGTVISLYLSPATATHKVGDSFAVDIRLAKNDNTFVNYVRADLTFPPNILTVSSVSTAGSYFAVNAGPQYTFNQHNNTTGTIDVAGESSSVAKSGDFLVATIHFTVKTAGTATVAFTHNSEAAFPINGQNILTSKTGGTYTIPVTAPPPAPTPAPNPTPTPPPVPKTTPPTPSTTTTTTQTTAPSDMLPKDTATASQADVPTITSVHITQLTATSAKISWQTDVSTTGVVQYGTSTSLLTSNVSDNNASVNHSVPLTNLAPGKKIYFEIVASTDTTQSSHSGSFTTPNSSRLASIVLGGGFVVVVLALIGLVLRNLRRRKPNSPTNSSDMATASMAPTPEALASAGVPPTPVNEAPEEPLAAQAAPIPPPPASAEQTPIAEQAAGPPVPLQAEPEAIPHSAPVSLLARTPLRPPTLRPRPSGRPQVAPALTPPTIPPLASPPLVPPPLPMPPPTTEVAASLVPPPGDTTDADDVPDMFEEGERRLEQEEQARGQSDHPRT